MPVAYSEDLRGCVIAACVAKEGSQRQLAQRFKVSLSFVRNLLRHYRANGQIKAKRRGGYLKPIIQDEHLTIVKSLVKEKNDLLLSELCDRFAQRTGIRVSVPTMHRAVEKLGLRCKKNSLCQRTRYSGSFAGEYSHRKYFHTSTRATA